MNTILLYSMRYRSTKSNIISAALAPRNSPHRRQSNVTFRSKSGQNQSRLLRRRRPWIPHQAPKLMVESRILNRPIGFQLRPHHLLGRLLRQGIEYPRSNRFLGQFTLQIPKPEARFPRRKSRFRLRGFSRNFASSGRWLGVFGYVDAVRGERRTRRVVQR